MIELLDEGVGVAELLYEGVEVSLDDGVADTDCEIELVTEMVDVIDEERDIVGVTEGENERDANGVSVREGLTVIDGLLVSD